jgi:large subunit ribosomal protein L30
MILVIRISGDVKIPSAVRETLYRMRLRRKYTAVLMNDSKETQALLGSVRNFVAYGEISDAALEALIEKRGQSIKKEKIDASKVAKDLKSKPITETGLKPFFRLHPPRGGIDSKKHFGVAKGVLGDNKESINKLVERML